MSRPPLLFLCCCSKTTGHGRTALHHARLLREAGHPVHFCCSPGGTLQQAAHEADLFDSSGPRLKTSGSPFGFALDARRLRSLVNRQQIGCIFAYRTHAHLLARVSVPGVPLIRFLHRPDRSIRLLDRLLIGSAQRVLMPSTEMIRQLSPSAGDEAVAEAMAGAGFRIWIPGGVDIVHFTPDRGGSRLRRELGLRDDQIVVGMVSRLKAGRGHSVFLQALSIAIARRPDLRGLLIGGGSSSERERILEVARQYGIAEHLCLLDPGNRFDEALAVLDVGVQMHPGSAGTADAALQLMSMARPVILTPPAGAVADLAAAAEAAVVTEDCVDPIADAIVRLAADPEQRGQIGMRARHLVEARLSRSVLQRLLTNAAQQASGCRRTPSRA